MGGNTPYNRGHISQGFPLWQAGLLENGKSNTLEKNWRISGKT
jgi:hypothetical protein